MASGSLIIMSRDIEDTHGCGKGEGDLPEDRRALDDMDSEDVMSFTRIVGGRVRAQGCSRSRSNTWFKRFQSNMST